MPSAHSSLLFAHAGDRPAASEPFYQHYLQEIISTYALAEFEPRMDRDLRPH